MLNSTTLFTVEIHGHWILQRFADPSQETGRICPVIETMIIGEYQGQHHPGYPSVIQIKRFLNGPTQTQYGRLGPIHDGCELGAADTALIGQGKRAAFHFVQRESFSAGALCQIDDFVRYFNYRLLVCISNHGNQQTPFGIHGHTQVNILFENDLPVLQVKTGIEVWKVFKPFGDDFHNRGHKGHFSAGFDLLAVDGIKPAV